MNNQTSKVIFISGASSGFGRRITEQALAQGHRVAATARRPESLQDLVEQYGGQVIALPLDVTNKAMAEEAVTKAAETFGRIDVLVNNAGFGFLGAIEEFSEAEARDQFETNVFGALWLTQAALPYMRQQASGHIINVSSVAGFVGYPGSGLYASSKHALEGLSQGLAREVESLGIKVTVVNPGPFRTEFAGRSLKLAQRKIEDYATTVHARQENLRNKISGRQAGDPQKAAVAVLEVIAMAEPPFTLPLGAIAYEEIPDRLKTTLDEIKRFESVGLPTDFEPAHANS